MTASGSLSCAWASEYSRSHDTESIASLLHHIHLFLGKPEGAHRWFLGTYQWLHSPAAQDTYRFHEYPTFTVDSTSASRVFLFFRQRRRIRKCFWFCSEKMVEKWSSWKMWDLVISHCFTERILKQEYEIVLSRGKTGKERMNGRMYKSEVKGGR